MDSIRIGFLSTRQDPRKIDKLYAFHAVASVEGVTLFYFTPHRVDFTNEKIRGLVYESGEWTEKIFPFPDVIYNERYPRGDRGAQIVDELYQRIPITSRSIGSKLNVYRCLHQGKKFRKYLIPSVQVSHVENVLAAIEQYGDLVLKPTYGHQGIGVSKICKDHEHYLVVRRDENKRMNDSRFREFVQTCLNEEEHIVQPFIVSKTKSGSTYDFRLHVQKNKQGSWCLTSIYPRVAMGNGVIPNLSGGGYTTMPKHFFQFEFGEAATEMHQILELFALELASHMDEIYSESFDELGIDVGLDERRHIWLFEVNWRPGPPPIWNVELDVARNSIHYAIYLASLQKRR